MARKSFEIDGYSHGNNPIPAASRIGNIVMTGGIGGFDLSQNKLADTLEEQCAQMFQLAEKVLGAADASFDDVLKVTVYMKPDLDRGPLNEVWLKYFPNESSRPVRHVIINPHLAGGMLIQCEMMAVIEAWFPQV